MQTLIRLVLKERSDIGGHSLLGPIYTEFLKVHATGNEQFQEKDSI